MELYGFSLMTGFVPLCKVLRVSFLVTFLLMKTNTEGAVKDTEKLLAGTKAVGTLILCFLASRTVTKACLLFVTAQSTQSKIHCYSKFPELSPDNILVIFSDIVIAYEKDSF